jgi:hypothetical protein
MVEEFVKRKCHGTTNITLLESSRISPARPSDRDSMKLKTSKSLEEVGLRQGPRKLDSLNLW